MTQKRRGRQSVATAPVQPESVEQAQNEQQQQSEPPVSTQSVELVQQPLPDPPVQPESVEQAQNEQQQQSEPPVSTQSVEPVNPLKITVKNGGSYDVFEPATITKIPKRKTVEIVCISKQQLNQALVNLRSLGRLNRLLEITHDAV